MFVAYETVVARVGAERLRQFLDDDGDGTPDSAVVAAIQRRVEGRVISRLMSKGWSRAQLEQFDGDPILEDAATDIWMGFAGERRSEFRNDKGQGHFQAELDRGLQMLDEIAKGITRLPDEGRVAAQRTTRGNLNAPTPRFVIANNRDDPTGPGGY